MPGWKDDDMEQGDIYGDYIESDDDERAPEFGEIEESAEPIRDYMTGHFYPVYIGEVLHGNYHIQHKLGRGGFSSVWLAYDIANRRNVALKIAVDGGSGEHEYAMHKEIQQNLAGHSSITTCLDSFQLIGYQGRRHRVLVLPVRGPSLGQICSQRPVAVRMAAAHQLLEAITCLHAMGIVHRDLNNGCALWGMGSLHKLDLKTKYEHLGRPQKVALPKEVWKKGDFVLPGILDIQDELLEDKIYLGDFGLSIKVGNMSHISGHQTPQFAAPELLHNIESTFARDIWSYMMLFAYLYLGAYPWWGPTYTYALSTMVSIFGPLPEPWAGRYMFPESSDPSWYDQSRTPDPAVESLDAKIIRHRPEVSATERRHVLTVLSLGFRYLPEDRITAAELLDHESFKAVMSFYQT